MVPKNLFLIKDTQFDINTSVRAMDELDNFINLEMVEIGEAETLTMLLTDVEPE